jgi:hypothetical protein
MCYNSLLFSHAAVFASACFHDVYLLERRGFQRSQVLTAVKMSTVAFRTVTPENGGSRFPVSALTRQLGVTVPRRPQWSVRLRRHSGSCYTAFGTKQAERACVCVCVCVSTVCVRAAHTLTLAAAASAMVTVADPRRFNLDLSLWCCYRKQQAADNNS